MQRSISVSASIPLISNRPASPPRVAPGVRLKVASIVWTAALIALGLGPTSVMAEDGPTTMTALRSATNGLWIGVGTDVRARTKAGLDRKAGRDLIALHGEYQTYLEQPQAKGRGASGFRSANILARVAAGHVVVDLVASGDPEALAADLEALGLHNCGGVRTHGLGPPADPGDPGSRKPGLAEIRPPGLCHDPGRQRHEPGRCRRYGRTNARSTFGVDGRGSRLGPCPTASTASGVRRRGSRAAICRPGSFVLEEIGDCTDAIDEGRALAEVIHDVAPGTAIAVHSAANGQASFAQGIIDLANAGAKVITDDIIYFAEPMFQDGIIAQAVDPVKARGISYFSAAGNDGRQSYESPFRGSGQFRDLGEGPDVLKTSAIDMEDPATRPSTRASAPVSA